MAQTSKKGKRQLEEYYRSVVTPATEIHPGLPCWNPLHLHRCPEQSRFLKVALHTESWMSSASLVSLTIDGQEVDRARHQELPTIRSTRRRSRFPRPSTTPPRPWPSRRAASIRFRSCATASTSIRWPCAGCASSKCRRRAVLAPACYRPVEPKHEGGDGRDQRTSPHLRQDADAAAAGRSSDAVRKAAAARRLRAGATRPALRRAAPRRFPARPAPGRRMPRRWSSPSITMPASCAIAACAAATRSATTRSSAGWARATRRRSPST